MIFKTKKHNLEECFNRIYETYHPLLYTIAFKILHDRDLAKDAMQNCCLRIYKNITIFETLHTSKIKTLVATIAKTSAIDVYRKKNRQNRFELLTNDFLNYPTANSFYFVDQILEKEELGGLRKYMNELSESYATVILYRYYFDFTYERIGLLMDISAGAARTKIYRAKTKIAELLKQDERYETKKL